MELNEISNRILAEMLEKRTGQELSINRRWRIASALSGLLRDRGITNIDQLIAMLTLPHEKNLSKEVVESLLNNETYFFRDRAPFDLLLQQALPELARRRATTRRLSIWSAGCSSGQEVLSLAMLFAEQESRWAGWTIDILGTDVSDSVLETARKGCYTQFEIQRGLGVARMMKWFEDTPEGWRANEKLRRMVRFQTHNILDPAPMVFSFDIVLCRNVLLYFDGTNRTSAFDRLAAAMAPDGWLMLGAGETVLGQTDRLVPDSAFSGLYRQALPGEASVVVSKKRYG